jgi:hypothetical protein
MNCPRIAFSCLLVIVAASAACLTAQEMPRDSTAITIRVSSVPANAEVFMDSVLQGRSPLTIITTNVRRHLVEVLLAEHVPYYQWVGRQTRDTLNVKVKLKPNWAWLSIHVFPPHSRVRIDTSEMGDPAGRLVRVSVGTHTLHFEDSAAQRSIDRPVEVRAADTVCINGRLGVPSLYPVVTSMFIPGSGQFYDRAPVEGAAFLAGVAASFYLMAKAASEYSQANADYSALLASYRSAVGETEALNLRNETLRGLDKSNSLARKRNVMVGITVAVYVANVLDAYLFHRKNDLVEFPANCDHGVVAPAVSMDDRGCRAGITITF